MKRIIALVLVLLLLASICISTSASSPRALLINPDMDFNGTTVICNLNVMGDKTYDEISATVKLFEGSRCIRTWSCEDKGALFFSRSVEGTKGEEYTLVAVVTFNGVTKPLVSVSGVLE